MLINAAAVIVAATLTPAKAEGQFRAAIGLAAEAIDSGAAGDMIGVARDGTGSCPEHTEKTS